MDTFGESHSVLAGVIREMLEQHIDSWPKFARCLRFLARQWLVVSIWLVVFGFFGFAYLLAGKRLSWHSADFLDFAGAFVIAAAIAAAGNLLVAGRGRWAFEATFPLLLLITVSVGAAYVMFWLAPSLAQDLLELNVREVVSRRQELLDSTREAAWLILPIALIVGGLIGGLAGLFFHLVKRRSRFVGWSVACLLAVCLIEPFHLKLFSSWIQLIVRLHLDWFRPVHPVHYGWYMRFAHASALGATVGAVVGSVIACGAVRKGVRRENLAPDSGSAGLRIEPAEARSG